MPSTAVTLTANDTDGQVWFNGSWTAFLYSPFGIPGPPYSLLGTNTPVPNQSQGGSLNNLGQATMTLTPNSSIAPAGTQWMFQTFPAANPAAASVITPVTISGVSQGVTITSPGLRINAHNPQQLIQAYQDIEVVFCLPGLTYFNLTDTFLHLCIAVAPNGVGTFTVVNTEPQPFDIAYYVVGAPTGNYEILRIPMDRVVTFPANLPGSQAVAEIAPTNAVQLTISRIPSGGSQTTIGTVNFAATSKTATFTFASQVVFQAGDIVVVTAPASPDATFGSIGGMFACTR